MEREMKITSDYAWIDVKRGRRVLQEAVNKTEVPITLRGRILNSISGDDGVSIEFQIDVDSVKLGKPKAKRGK